MSIHFHDPTIRSASTNLGFIAVKGRLGVTCQDVAAIVALLHTGQIIMAPTTKGVVLLGDGSGLSNDVVRQTY
ncbi:hypothetical protein [Hymenobacter volaticus]|uniref:Uncharacterized protein n=1 Tax=Hymenobacter volaticus TaxID=2932254 RepID=A0ABY4GC73_9BACT|nr:hypothetical protein [Hymenobacter volaticus]UOQ68341.1 hypothetical protein MUN86_11090 [Hymenobacter volaticus]